MDFSAVADGVVSASGPEPTVLSLEGITHRFGSVLALNDASLRVRPGTVHAVLGENGAGKTTLMRVAFGLLQPERGTIRIGDVERTIASPSVALSLGVGMVHQHFTLVSAMTVAENVALGGTGAFDPRAAATRVRDVAQRAGLTLEPNAIVGTLAVGAQQRCEIVKALARDVRLLILDEPTAVLAPSDAAELLRWIRRHADAGYAVVLITHKLRDALAIADDVTVLRRGKTVLTARAATTTERMLANAMLGQETADVTDGVSSALIPSPISTETSVESSPQNAQRSSPHASPHAPQRPPTSESPTQTPILATNALRVTDDRGVERLRGATMHVNAGEIVGIAAIEGAGQRELLRVLAGRIVPTRGDVVRPAVVGFVPEDRHHDALLLDASLVENIALRGAGQRRGRMPWRALRETLVSVVRGYDVRGGDDATSARALSGGNQQKLVLGRELASAPSALVVENPSRGLDFRATEAVRDALRSARDDGAAVVVYSSDLDEVLSLADRVYAMHDGMLTEVVNDRETVGRAMLGSGAISLVSGR